MSLLDVRDLSIRYDDVAVVSNVDFSIEAGEALGLTVEELGGQLRTAFDGHLVQILQDGPDEVEVRVRLPEQERARLGSLHRHSATASIGTSSPEGSRILRR